jgi:hypothetical protein
MHAPAEAKWAVYRAIDTLLEAIANGRHQQSLACFTDDADVALLGSEEGEQVIGPLALREFFANLYAQPYRILFTLPERRVSLAGNVAWFAGEGTYRLSSEDTEHPYRLVGVLERRRDVWLWQLFSGSEPK